MPYNTFLFLICILFIACKNKQFEPKVTYATNYLSVDDSKWSIHCDFLENVIPFPYDSELSDISKYYNVLASGIIGEDGMNDSMYYFKSKNMKLSIAAAQEVGFLNRYPYMMLGQVEGSNVLLLNGIEIGGSANQLKDIIPDAIMNGEEELSKEQLMKRFSTMKELELRDQWDMYSHRYIIKNSRIEKLIVSFR